MAELLAMIANCHRDDKVRRRPFTAYEFFHRPGAKRPRFGNALTVDFLHGMREAFTKR